MKNTFKKQLISLQFYWDPYLLSMINNQDTPKIERVTYLTVVVETPAQLTLQ